MYIWATLSVVKEVLLLLLRVQVVVDFVVTWGKNLVAIEVKSAEKTDSLPGMQAFSAAFGPSRKLLIGGDGIELGEFMSQPVRHWVG